MLAVAWTVLLITAFVAAFPAQQAPNNPTPSVYDYVVMGCGVAGLVVASRLSENPELSVLCIEAGPL